MNNRVKLIGSINDFSNLLADKDRRMVELSDFAMIMGCNYKEDPHDSDGYINSGLTGTWITLETNGSNCVGFDELGNMVDIIPTQDNFGIRPTIDFDNINGMPSNDIYELYYGEFPQSIVNAPYGLILENKYLNGELEVTGKSFDIYPYDEEHIFEEYFIDGHKFIRCFPKKTMILDDSLVHMPSSPCWVEVEPIKWLVDNSTNTMITNDILISGIPFNIENNNNYDNSLVKDYLENHFVKQIIQNNYTDSKDNSKTR